MSSVSIYNPAQNNYGTLSRDREDGFEGDWPDLTPHDKYRHNHHHHYHHRHREHHHRHSKHRHTSNNTSITTVPGESVPTPPSENHEWHMKIDTFETESQFVVLCELPGIHYKDVSVNVNDHTLEIKAIKPLLTNTTLDSVVDLSEITYGPSSRVVRIPLYVDQNEAQISLVEGILTVVFQKIGAEKEGWTALA